MHQSSGLKEVVSMVDVFTEVTTTQIWAGKHYNRGVKLHKLVYEAIIRQKLLALGEWLSEEGYDEPLTNLQLSGNDELKAVIDILVPLIEKFDGHLNETSPMGKFWKGYLKAVEILLSFVYAERSPNWELYLDSIVAMLPIFFAYGRINYSKWLPIYILDMLDLKETAPSVHKKLFRMGSSLLIIQEMYLQEWQLTKY